MHIPVLLHEALTLLQPKDGNTYVDATFGNGGYTTAILQHCNCKVIALDRDPTTTPKAMEIKQQFGKRFEFINDKFSNITHYISHADGIVADFGISSMHVDDASRGFSFQKDAPLNMQMGKCEISAFDVINTFSEEQLSDIIFKYSNEHLAKKIATAIFHTRKKSTIYTTTQLAEIIYNTYGKPRHYKIHPATKTFQAIRVFVNNELEEIESLLTASGKIITTGGRLVCVSFHELEDRLVKNYLTENSQKKQKVNKYSQHIEPKQNNLHNTTTDNLTEEVHFEKNLQNNLFTIITKNPLHHHKKKFPLIQGLGPPNYVAVKGFSL